VIAGFNAAEKASQILIGQGNAALCGLVISALAMQEYGGSGVRLWWIIIMTQDDDDVVELILSPHGLVRRGKWPSDGTVIGAVIRCITPAIILPKRP
jgi:hypothetical protein